MQIDLRTNKTNAPFEYLLKSIIVGDSGVGKSTLLYRLLNPDKPIDPQIPSTIGIDFGVLYATTTPRESSDPLSNHYKIQIWDCAGQARYRSIVRSYFRGTHLIIIAFDVCNRQSFENVKWWFQHTVDNIQDPKKVAFLLVGTKTDLGDLRKVQGEEIQQLADDLGIPFTECNCVNNRVEKIITFLLQKFDERIRTGEILLPHPLDSSIITVRRRSPTSFFSKRRGGGGDESSCFNCSFS